MKDTNDRELSNKEIVLVERLFQRPFQGSDVLYDQIKKSKVREIFEKDGNFWGLDFVTDSRQVAEIDNRIPVEAETNDAGSPLQVLLHVVNGKVKHLELVRYDNKIRKEFPDITELHIKINK